MIKITSEAQRLVTNYKLPPKVAQCYTEEYYSEKCEICKDKKICQAINVLDNMF